MKKVLSLVLTVCLLASLATLAASASDLLTTTSAAAGQTTPPDWVITEICPDTSGDGTGGYTDGKDVGEFIEIYNNSGKELNIYDYCMTYNGNGRTNEKFETQIVEITPFKAGDFFDGSTAQWTDTSKYTPCDLTNKPVNPDTFVVKPGEVIVLWVLYCEPYYNLWNEGKGFSMDNFRTLWQIPDDVRVLAVDGNSSTTYGGHDKNFNVKNSATGTYGIALYSDALNTAANTATGGDNNYPVVYTESAELCAWATMDFDAQIMGESIANLTYNYTYDFNGLAAKEWDYVADTRRMLFLEKWAEATPGRLTTLQKISLGVALDAGDSIEVDNMYAPDASLGDFQGFIIDDVLYGTGTTFTAAKAGTVKLQYKYANDGLTYGGSETTPVTEPPVTTAAPEKDTTKAPEKDTTAAPVTEKTPGGDETKAPTTDAPKEEKKGCGSVIGFGVLACLLPAALIITKKKH